MSVKSLIPLVVDLDGTLILTDMLHESALQRAKARPWDVLRFPVWAIFGKAILKRRLAGSMDFDPAVLPFHATLLSWLRDQAAHGRPLVLCTATDIQLARPIAEHLGIFTDVMASDGCNNLAGKHKAQALVARYGAQGFDYAGNSRADLAVWMHARQAVVVNASTRVRSQAAELCPVEHEFATPPRPLRVWMRVLRVHQWMKNLLLAVPLLAAHRGLVWTAWHELGIAFAAFSLCASAVYIANDLTDLESDRQHPRKRQRPFASGEVSAMSGVALGGALLVLSAWLASHVGGTFFPWLVVYFVVTCAYSWGLKRFVLLDCLALAMLYTLRIVAGAAAISQSLSFWLLAFSVFLFLSLAFVKRYAELQVQAQSGRQAAHGRGYLTTDASLVQTLGVTAGYAAALVLALYLNSEAVLRLYLLPEAVWGAVPVTLFWVSWMWMQAHRGLMHDDPLVFAVKDRASLAAGLLFAFVVFIGARGI